MEPTTTSPITEAVFNDSSTRKKVCQIFAIYDSDGDGFIGLEELANLITDKKCKGLPLHMARSIIKKYDQDGDGQLDFEEFYRLSKVNKSFFEGIMALYILKLIPLRDGGFMILRPELRFKLSCVPPPLTMIIFSLVQILIFVLDSLYVNRVATKENRNITVVDAPISKEILYNPQKRYEFWRFCTYMFTHVDAAHIIKNLFFQVFLGVPLEIMHKWWRVAVIYLAGGTFGSIATSAISPSMYLAGASGGVYALLTAHLATVILNWSEMSTALPQVAVIIIFCSYDMSVSISNYQTGTSRVGFVSHLAGGIAGLLVGIGILRNLKERRWQRVVWWIAVFVFSVLMFVAIIVNILCPSHFLNNFRE